MDPVDLATVPDLAAVHTANTREAFLATNQAASDNLRHTINQLRQAQEKARMESIRLEREIEKVSTSSGLLSTSLHRVMNGSVRLSDHAIVRYLERVKGLDLEALRREIVPEETELAILLRVRADGIYQVAGPDGYSHEVRTGSVIDNECHTVTTVWKEP